MFTVNKMGLCTKSSANPHHRPWNSISH